MNTLVTATEEELAKTSSPSTARAVLAYARTPPQGGTGAAGTSGHRPYTENAAGQSECLKSNQRAKATELALSAYLDGFEPLEATLDGTDRQLQVNLERIMLLHPGAVAQGNVLGATEYAEQLDAYFVRVEELTRANKTDATTVFVGALTILLRDGVEGLLS
jgi:high-affinity iron transporter